MGEKIMKNKKVNLLLLFFITVPINLSINSVCNDIKVREASYHRQFKDLEISLLMWQLWSCHVNITHFLFYLILVQKRSMYLFP